MLLENLLPLIDDTDSLISLFASNYRGDIRVIALNETKENIPCLLFGGCTVWRIAHGENGIEIWIQE